jgi:hypothetical protein
MPKTYMQGFIREYEANVEEMIGVLISRMPAQALT